MTNTQKEPNPYNARKPWHTPDKPRTGTADDAYTPDQRQEQQSATRQNGPEAGGVNWKKRYDDLKNHYDKTVAQQKQEAQQDQAEQLVKQEAHKGAVLKTPKTVEELEEFKREYPDLYDTIKSVSKIENSELAKGVEDKLEQLSKAQQDLAKKRAKQELERMHPDFQEIVESEKFQDWAKAQPEVIQSWIFKNPDDAELAGKAIDFYKAEVGIKSSSSRSNSKGSAADMVSTKTTHVDAKQPKIWTEAEIKALDLDEYEKYEEEIDLAILEGRVRR